MTLSPETQMMGFGYNPWWSEGSVKPPLFLTSTFMFHTAEDGEEFFKVALGRKKSLKAQGLIYSRLNNPELEILEGRLALWEKAEAGAAFASGMAAITTTVLSLCRPGDVIAYNLPIYGGTSHLFSEILPHFNIRAIPVFIEGSPAQQIAAMNEPRLRMIFIETPSNPTMEMIDLGEIIRARNAIEKQYGSRIYLAVDNTMFGPVFQKPLLKGADLSLYSATKFIGGHSDLIAGAVLGSKDAMKDIVTYRSFLGTMSDPFTCWQMMRSLETLKIRMETQARNAFVIAKYLSAHKKIGKIHYPGLFERNSEQYKIMKKQCEGFGSLISFEVKGGKRAAFRMLNKVSLCHLAVSLGGTETLIEHPKTMTHSEMEPALQQRSGVTDGLIRLSVGLENPTDLIADMGNALK